MGGLGAGAAAEARSGPLLHCCGCCCGGGCGGACDKLVCMMVRATFVLFLQWVQAAAAAQGQGLGAGAHADCHTCPHQPHARKCPACSRAQQRGAHCPACLLARSTGARVGEVHALHLHIWGGGVTGCHVGGGCAPALLHQQQHACIEHPRTCSSPPPPGWPAAAATAARPAAFALLSLFRFRFRVVVVLAPLRAWRHNI